ncbi:hypothetical protein AB0B94_30740 [Micromonospora sp. NPDC048986]|uniref:hypothetical protein n=1 Tax=Micromonospora sp. NPDC048986 TaxID=3155644 RepID=UPI0033C81547
MTFLVAAGICGLALLLGDTRPASVAASMPVWLQSTWEVGLLVCGVVGLVGIWWRGALVSALAVELGALFLLGALTAMYTIALFSVSAGQATAAGAFVSAVAVASWWRSGQIIRDLRRLYRVSAEGGA